MAIGRVITVLGAAGLAWAWGNREQLKEKWGRMQGGSNSPMGQPGQAGEGSGMERSAGMGGAASGTSPTGEYGSAAGPMGSRGAGGMSGSSPNTGTSTTSVDDDSMTLGTGPSPAGI